MRNRFRSLALCLALSPLTLAANTTPSLATFATAIAAKIGPQAKKCAPFPDRVGPDGKQLVALLPSTVTTAHLAVYRALEARGWVTIYTGMATTEMFVGTVRQKAVIVDLTPKGQVLFKANGGYLCYGRVALVKVDNYSVPTQMMGMTLSEVNFTYHIVDIPEWARDKAIAAVLTPLGKAPNERQMLHGTATLVLYNDGWRVDGTPNTGP
jgi:hypothetical protein